MFEAVGNPPDADFWTKVLDYKFLGKGEKWRPEEMDGVLGDCQVCELIPSTMPMSDPSGVYGCTHGGADARVDCGIPRRQGHHRNA